MFKVNNKTILAYLYTKYNLNPKKNYEWYREDDTIVVRLESKNNVPGVYFGTFPLSNDDMLQRLLSVMYPEAEGGFGLSASVLINKDMFHHKLQLCKNESRVQYLRLCDELTRLYSAFPHLKTWVYDFIDIMLDVARNDKHASLLNHNYMLLLQDDNMEKTLKEKYNRIVYEQKRHSSKYCKTAPLPHTISLSSKEYLSESEEWKKHGWDIVCNPIQLTAFNLQDLNHIHVLLKSFQEKTPLDVQDIRNWKKEHWTFMLNHMDESSNVIQKAIQQFEKNFIVVCIHSAAKQLLDVSPFIHRFIPESTLCNEVIQEAKMEYLIHGEIKRDCHSRYFSKKNPSSIIEEESLYI